MAWTNYQSFLVILMILTGCINTLSAKWMDGLDAEGKGGNVHLFHHPFFQASCMFIGEMLCLLMFKITYKVYSIKADGSEDVKTLTRGNRHFNPWVLLPPAMCDMCASSIMYIGLNLTYASSYQMLRGAVIIFVAVLSILFLHRVITLREAFGIGFVIIGLITVGLADALKGTGGKHTKNDMIVGDLLIIFAQCLTATQMVYEEKYVVKLDIPSLQAVGWEGMFGFVVLGLLQIPFYFIKVERPFANNPSGVLEDAIDAFIQIGHNWQLAMALTIMIISIAFFNFAGISVTRELSATTRKVMDSVRTLIIWIVSLCFMGQKFHWTQLLGFILLIIGMFLYNNVYCTFLYGKIQSLWRSLCCKSGSSDDGGTDGSTPA